jgi:hypothetical protein
VTSTGRANPLLPVKVRTRSRIPWTSASKEAFLADIGEASAMADDYRDLANRLFATATAMLEDAIEVAVAGQSRRLDPSNLADHGRRLQAAAHDITIIAEAAAIVADWGIDSPPNRRNSTC